MIRQTHSERAARGIKITREVEAVSLIAFSPKLLSGFRRMRSKR
jgi:hypothetical protein